MTIQSQIQNTSTPKAPQYPAVLNFRKLHPRELGKFRMHDQRRGGDLSHVDMAASALNVVLHGESDWIKQIRDEIQDARLNNHVEYLEALKRKSRHKDAATLTAAGPSDPWMLQAGAALPINSWRISPRAAAATRPSRP